MDFSTCILEMKYTYKCELENSYMSR